MNAENGQEDGAELSIEDIERQKIGKPKPGLADYTGTQIGQETPKETPKEKE